MSTPQILWSLFGIPAGLLTVLLVSDKVALLYSRKGFNTKTATEVVELLVIACAFAYLIYVLSLGIGGHHG